MEGSRDSHREMRGLSGTRHEATASSTLMTMEVVLSHAVSPTRSHECPERIRGGHPAIPGATTPHTFAAYLVTSLTISFRPEGDIGYHHSRAAATVAIKDPCRLNATGLLAGSTHWSVVTQEAGHAGQSEATPRIKPNPRCGKGS
ncbi:hypothetical protein CHELA40_10833 [Chelatococcus asaccharovorans]|nr:hypothetical protein CHELA40_10833 [Chelatococcus asaccharovorans]CAH1685965.1 hypothetical protein CHELA17_64770 [Chelatococcus asaccharovorans]